VLSRRFARGRGAAEGSESETWDLPDLFLVDGGRGQLAVALTAAHDLGLYTNLVTSALGLSRPKAEQLQAAGLDHVQVSIQADEPAVSDRIAGTPSFRRKIEAMGLVTELGWPLTVNVVLHRQNIDRVAAVLELAEEVGADRVELANTQYYGWAWRNRDALLPSRAQLEAAESSCGPPASGCGTAWTSSTSSPTTTAGTRSPAWAAGPRGS
jgi:hypothetical protein